MQGRCTMDSYCTKKNNQEEEEAKMMLTSISVTHKVVNWQVSTKITKRNAKKGLIWLVCSIPNSTTRKTLWQIRESIEKRSLVRRISF